MDKPRSQPVDRLGYLWLAIGAVLSLLAEHGRWAFPPAACLCGVFLLRYSRTRRPLAGFIGVWAVAAATGVFWLYESGLDPVNPILLALAVALSTVLVLPYLADRLVAPRLSPAGPLLATLVFPLGRVMAEYVNATLSPVGDIFGSLAATQHDNLALLQVSAATGSYGVSFLIAWFASACNGVWENRFSWPRTRTVVVVFGAVLAAVLAGGALRLAFFPPTAATVRVAGISPAAAVLDHRAAVLNGFTSMEELAKADHGTLRPVFAAANDDLLATTEREARAGAQIIVWSEAAAGMFAEDKPEFIRRASAIARDHDVYLMMGLGVLTSTPPYNQNQAVLIDPQGRVVWTYDKAHPVPALEELTPGDGRVPNVDTPYGRLANLICFDADFPYLARQAGRDGVDLMLVPSNDWREFGETHTQKATIRAIENGYALVRQDTNGLARAVDHQGRVLASSNYFTTDQQTIIAYVPSKGTRTIYASIGDVFVWLCVAAFALLFVTAVWAARRQTAVTVPVEASPAVRARTGPYPGGQELRA